MAVKRGNLYEKGLLQNEVLLSHYAYRCDIPYLKSLRKRIGQSADWFAMTNCILQQAIRLCLSDIIMHFFKYLPHCPKGQLPRCGALPYCGKGSGGAQ